MALKEIEKFFVKSKSFMEKAKKTTIEQLNNGNFLTNIFLLCFFFFSLSFSLNLCKPNFNEQIYLQFADKNLVAIPDIEVKLYYQKTYSFGKIINGTLKPIYVETLTKKTDKDGKVTLSVVNNEPDEKRLDCKITVFYKFFGNNYSYSIDLSDVVFPVLIIVDAYTIPIKVFEDNKMRNATLVFSTNYTLEVPDNGLYVAVPAKEIEGYAILRDKKVKKYFKEKIEANSALLISFVKVKTFAQVFNDREEPLPFNLTIENVNYSSLKGEKVEIIIYEGLYDGILFTDENEFNVTLDTRKGLVYYVDNHAPKITSIFIEQDKEDNAYYLKAYITDEGKFASGMASVKAYINGIERPMGLKKDVFILKLTDLKDKNSLLLEAYDKAGNKKVIQGTIYYQKARTEVKEETTQEIDIVTTLLIIVGVAIVAVIIYIVKTMYS